MKRFVTLLGVLDRLFARAVNFSVIVSLLVMATLTLTQVVLRDFFSSGIVGAEIVARHLVLWIAFLGGMMATRRRQHVSIDIVTRLLSRRARNVLCLILDGVAGVVAWWLAKAAYSFVLAEQEMAAMLIGNIPIWWAEAIIPFGFAMIALEYAIGVALDAWQVVIRGDVNHVAGDWRRYISR
ncbi:MAG: TRAP transporter small permease [Deltaproteobacteria bacterium]|nr:TRAP transporter small permease [Deltaproteobacteria bacterium]